MSLCRDLLHAPPDESSLRSGSDKEDLAFIQRVSDIYNNNVIDGQPSETNEAAIIRAEIKKFVKLCKDNLPQYIDKQDAARNNFAGTFVRDGLTLEFSYGCFCALLGERITIFLTGPVDELPGPDGTTFQVLKDNGREFVTFQNFQYFYVTLCYFHLSYIQYSQELLELHPC